LQQLEMESLGKSVTASGQPVSWTTGPIVWGEPGNNAQHSFFQLLHQGTPRAALDILLPARSAHSRGAGVRSGGGSGAGGDVSQHDLAIANALAQAEAFAFGHPHADAHRAHEGNRPVSLLAFESLDPRTLGRLIALYEHKVFAQSVLWGINAFDQWGVELGKRLCADLLPAVNGDRAAESAGVRALLARLRPWR
jgi:glucose-6-phosphate isomerase